MKSPSAHALELYFLEQADRLVRFGDQSTLLSLLGMSICLRSDTHDSVQSLSSAERVEHIRQRMRGIFDPRQYLNRCLKEGRRPNPRSKFSKRYFRLRERRYWQGGGVADCIQSAAQFENAESEIRYALRQVFGILSPMLEAPEAKLRWTDSAGVSGHGSYSILGRSMRSEGYYLPKFSVMRAHGTAASHPERAWTPTILDADEILRTVNSKGHRLLNEMDSVSPLGLLVGLNGLSFELHTELTSSLSLANAGLRSEWAEPELMAVSGYLVMGLSLVSFRHHAECALSSSRTYLEVLADMATQIHSAVPQKWVMGKVAEAKSQLRRLERRLPLILEEVEGILASVGSGNAPHGAQWDGVAYLINRYGEELKSDVAGVMGRLREMADSRLDWSDPQLSIEIELKLPPPNGEDMAVQFKLVAVADWSTIIASSGQPDGMEYMGWLTKVISNQRLPWWAWHCISEIRASVRLFAAISEAEIKGRPRPAA